MKPTHASIVSHTEKRTRIRVVSAHRNSANMKKFVAAVKTLPCVDKVHTRTHTGSILIEHKGGTRDQFKGVFEDIGCILRSTLFLDLPEGIKEPKNLDLPQAIRDLDSRMGFKNSPFRFSGQFDFKRVDLSLFPAPHMLLADPKLSLVQRFTASAQVIEVYPEILPLFSGKINLKHARIRQPDLILMLPEPTAADQAPATPVAVGDLVRSVSTALAALPEFNLPVVNTRITGGRLKLLHNKTTALELHDLEADLQSGSDKVTFQITAAKVPEF